MKTDLLIYCAFITLAASCKKINVNEPGLPISNNNPGVGSPITGFPFDGLNNDSNTTASWQQLFVIFGNSLARGRSEANGPTPKANTVFEWADTTLVRIGSKDLLAADQGSPWPQFGIDYNKNFATKVVFSNNAVSGSYFSPTRGDNGNNWSITGLRYSEMITKVNGALAALKVQKPRAIFVELGINDARSTVNLSTIQSDVNSLFKRLETDFPGVRIYVTNIGRHEDAISNARIDSIRSYMETEVTARADVFMVHDLRIFANDFPQHYDSDLVHLKQSGNNAWGAIMATFLTQH